MRMIKPWLDGWIYRNRCSYDELPDWLWHPYGCFGGILDDQVSDDAVKEILYILCANGDAPIGPDAKETLRGLYEVWKTRFPGYLGGFFMQTGRAKIHTGCCHNIDDFMQDLDWIAQLKEGEQGPWLGHDPDTEVRYQGGYLRFFEKDFFGLEGTGRRERGVSFTLIEFAARAWVARWDLYRFTYGPFRKILTDLCPELADDLVFLWCENLSIRRPPEHWR